LHRLQDTETDDLTLKELMDVVLIGEGAATVNMQTSALLAMNGIGTKGFIAAAIALTTLDMGPRCNALWRRRIANLKGPWACIPAALPRHPPHSAPSPSAPLRGGTTPSPPWGEGGFQLSAFSFQDLPHAQTLEQRHPLPRLEIPGHQCPTANFSGRD
jgi:hypothetical protein